MNDNNRIQIPGQGPKDNEQPVRIDMIHIAGLVQLRFDPPIVRMRLQPHEARSLAIAMLTHAEKAEYPEPKIEP